MNNYFKAAAISAIMLQGLLVYMVARSTDVESGMIMGIACILANALGVCIFKGLLKL